MLFRGRSFSSSAFSLFIVFVMIFSTISCCMCLESRAAETNVINDANKDNQITLDEVDPAQLATYGLVTGYGVTGSDVTGSITSSSAYTTALSEAAGSENTIIVGTVADGKVTFGEWFQNLCTNVYAELTDADVIGYISFPSISQQTLVTWLDENVSSGVLSDGYYADAYNFLTTKDLSGDIVKRSNDGEVFGYYSPYALSNILCFNALTDEQPLYYAVVSSSGSYSFNYLECSRWSFSNPTYWGTHKVYYYDDSSYFCIGYSLPVFISQPACIQYMNMNAPLYYSFSASKDLESISYDTLNLNDWSALSSQVYTHVSSAVTDANVTTVSQIQSIIDSEMSDLTEFIEEKEDSGSEEGGSDGSGSNSDLSDKLEQGNQLQQESNELQQENNELQKEENETSKGILGKLTDFFGSFFDNLIDSVVGLFVPSSDELKALFDRLDEFFSEKFGFFYYPFDFLIQAFDIFLSSDSSTGLTFPGFSIMGYEVWSDYTYDIASDPVAGTIFEYVRIGTGAILSIFFVGYLSAFFEKRFGGGGS